MCSSTPLACPGRLRGANREGFQTRPEMVAGWRTAGRGQRLFVVPGVSVRFADATEGGETDVADDVRRRTQQKGNDALKKKEVDYFPSFFKVSLRERNQHCLQRRWGEWGTSWGPFGAWSREGGPLVVAVSWRELQKWFEDTEINAICSFC